MIIPLDQYRSGMLSYANKIKDKLDYNLIIDERNIPNFQKRKEALDKKVPLIIYIGKKDLKNKTANITLFYVVA